jgi:hypothetical protein
VQEFGALGLEDGGDCDLGGRMRAPAAPGWCRKRRGGRGGAGRGCGHARRIPARLGALVAGVGLDLGDDVGAGGAVAGLGEIAPARQRREVDLVLGGELPRGDALAAAAGVELGGAVVPGAAELVTGGEGANAGEPRPVDGAIDEALLASVLKDIAEASDGGGVVSDDDGAIASGGVDIAPQTLGRSVGAAIDTLAPVAGQRARPADPWPPTRARPSVTPFVDGLRGASRAGRRFCGRCCR